jgi:hypothetical protein
MPLDYDLDLNVSLKTETEFTSLYSWCLVEKKESGEQVGPDLIPFNWSVSFVSEKFGFSESVSSKDVFRFRSEEELKPLKFSRQAQIFAKLRTGTPFEDDWRQSPSLSMMGCGRTVDDITLGIYRVDDKMEESCLIWGSPSYSYENDFRNEKTEDAITVSFYLNGEKFDALLELVKENQIDWIKVRLSDVEGFYSEWSPSISTDSIKVLANIADQGLDVNDDWKRKIPTLGKVGQASLSLQRTLKASVTPQSSIDTESGALGEEFPIDANPNRVQGQVSGDDAQYKLLERSLSRVTKLLGVLVLIEILRAIF